MKKFLCIICLLIAVVSVNQLNAQVKAGFKMGMDLSKFVYKNKDNTNESDTSIQRLISPRLGFIMEIPVYKGLFIQPGIFGAVRGDRYNSYRYKDEEFKKSREFDVVICIDVPVNIGYKYEFDGLSVFGMVGPVFTYNTYITNLYRIDGEYDNDHLSVGTGENDDIKPFAFNIDFEAGVQLNRFQFSAAYIHGLSNQLPESYFTEGNSLKSNVFSISVAILFGKVGNNSGYGYKR